MKRKKLFNNFGSFITKNSLGFLVGLLITGTTVVAAATTIVGTSVVYNGSKNFTSTNVSGAIDELYEMLSECPDALNCKKKLCRRATSLHTETCTTSYCQADGYASGGKITYGSKGTTGTLKPGDAFDCDVNCDGTYNATYERFYYVSHVDNGKTENNNVVALIYYNNVKAGEINNTETFRYNTDYSATDSGPLNALEQLPTISQWSNVGFTAVGRDIVDDNLDIRVNGFSYSGYAARLLTYQEVHNGCYDGTLELTDTGSLSSKCKFLLENTSYSASGLTGGYWLETRAISATRSYAYIVNPIKRNFFSYMVSNWYGIRPVIEVSLSDIDY